VSGGNNAARGVLRLALLRADGIGQFAASRRSFLVSMAVLIAFPAAGCLLSLLSGEGLEALTALLGTLVGLLAPPVLSAQMARFWGREREWLRYAIAFNWTRWAMLLALLLALMLMAMLAAAGLTQSAAVAVGVFAVAAYGVVLDWFVARVGLRLDGWRAAGLVVVVNVGSALLFLGPRLLAGLPQGPAP
jgi:hypothetical protein